MKRKGAPYGKAVRESFFSSLMQDLTHHEQFVDRQHARTKVFDYIEMLCNRQRLLSRHGLPLAR